MKKLFLLIGLIFFTITSYVFAKNKEINIDCVCQKAEYEETLDIMTPRSCDGSHNDMKLNRLSGSFTIYDPPIAHINHSNLFLAEPLEAELSFAEGSPNYYKWNEIYRWKVDLEGDEPFYAYHEFKIQINRINLNTTLDYRVALRKGDLWPNDLSYEDSTKLKVLYQCKVIDNLL